MSTHNLRLGQIWRNKRQIREGHDPQKEIRILKEDEVGLYMVGKTASYGATSHLSPERLTPSQGYELLFDPAPLDSHPPAKLLTCFEEVMGALEEFEPEYYLSSGRAALSAIALGGLDPLASFVIGKTLTSQGDWKQGYWAESAGFLFDPSSKKVLPGEEALKGYRRETRLFFNDKFCQDLLTKWQEAYPLEIKNVISQIVR
jgi:hypothetical protein